MKKIMYVFFVTAITVTQLQASEEESNTRKKILKKILIPLEFYKTHKKLVPNISLDVLDQYYAETNCGIFFPFVRDNDETTKITIINTLKDANPLSEIVVVYKKIKKYLDTTKKDKSVQHKNTLKNINDLLTEELNFMVSYVNNIKTILINNSSSKQKKHTKENGCSCVKQKSTPLNNAFIHACINFMAIGQYRKNISKLIDEQYQGIVHRGNKTVKESHVLKSN